MLGAWRAQRRTTGVLADEIERRLQALGQIQRLPWPWTCM